MTGRWDKKPSLAETREEFMNSLNDEGKAHFYEITESGKKRIDELPEKYINEFGSVERERCWECSRWSGGWISGLDYYLDESLVLQVCPECAKKPEFKDRHVMYMYDIRKLHEEHPNIPSYDPNFILNRGWPKLWEDDDKK
jgi:hypothetical protein